MLWDLLNIPHLLHLAGPRSFRRGEAYYEAGRVRSISESGSRIKAKVQGTHMYRVELWPDGRDLGFMCSCPFGDEGNFCKHCVAAGLAWMEKETGAEHLGDDSNELTCKDLRQHLTGLKKAALVEMILEQAKEDERLHARLMMQVAGTGPRKKLLATFRMAIDNAADPGEDWEFFDSYEYGQGIDQIEKAVTDLLQQGHAGEVVDLSEYAIKALISTREEAILDDYSLSYHIERFQRLHLAACRKARPKPKALARLLLEFELGNVHGVFPNLAEQYAEVLGEEGRAVYRDMVEAEWEKIPALAPREHGSVGLNCRHTLTRIMENLAESSGDLEALVEVKTRDLSWPGHFLEIAKLYKKAGMHDRVLDWTVRGLKAFPGRQGDDLRDFLADEYQRRKRGKEAVALIWERYEEDPGLLCYQKLKKHADRTGSWAALRKKALSFLRKEIGKHEGRRSSRRGWEPLADRSLLVEIFLWEGDPDAAWSEAQEGGCNESLRLELAAAREEEHPADAIAIYRPRIEPIVDRKNKQAYQEAADLLKKIGCLMERCDQGKEFDRYITEVQTRHKRKRNFMKLLDKIPKAKTRG